MKPTKDTQQFWLMLYAIDAFRYVQWACAQLIEHTPHESDLIYRTFMTAILINYSRPFRKNFGVGILDDSIVPPIFKELHTQLILERDKVHAHYDAQDIPTHIGNANQVRLLRLPDTFRWHTSIYLPYDMNKIPQIRCLCQVLIDELDRKTDEYQKRYLPEIKSLSQGEYLLNTDLKGSELFIKADVDILPPNNDLDATPI